MDFLVAFVAMLFTVPLVTGYVATSRGRSFWKWFALSLLLPIVSFALLLVLPDKSA
jgi:hypothetical protein